MWFSRQTVTVAEGPPPGGPPARRARHRHLLSGRDVHGFLRARQQAGLVWQRDVERFGLD